MAKTKQAGESQTTPASPSKSNAGTARFCSLPVVAPRVFNAAVSPGREELILLLGNKWANGTILHYYFFNNPSDGAWVARDPQEKQVVRDAFLAWKNVGIGIEFQEVTNREEAEIRIGFMEDDGSWSYVGRDILKQPDNQRTMNFGWSLTGPHGIDTAIHEIGHTLGFQHEHQNGNSGIVWNEEAVYKALAESPNFWPRETTYFNIIRKIPPDQVKGSNWDPDSVMHYPFSPGLIKSPEKYQNGLFPKGGLSELDKHWVRQFYPLLDPLQDPLLKPFQSATLALKPGEQRNFLVEPPETRYYTIQVFGSADLVAVLFEEIDGKFKFSTADDDSGEDRNATIRIKLFKGKRYKLRVRLYYNGSSREGSVMMW